jgi:hypothetical protein
MTAALGVLLCVVAQADAPAPAHLTIEAGDGCPGFTLVADGRTLCTLRVGAYGADGKPVDAVVRVESTDGRLRVIDGTVTLAHGAGASRIQAPDGLEGVATLKLSGEGVRGEALTIVLAHSTIGIDVTRTFGALASFILLMLLVSIAAEKLTDLLKLFILKSLDPPVDWFAKTGANLLTLEDAGLKRLAALMKAKTEGDVIGSVRDARQEVERRATVYATQLRLIAAALGCLVAVLLHLNAFVQLAPLLGAAPPFLAGLGGELITGVAASAGAAFWQDFLDRLTQWKRTASM